MEISFFTCYHQCPSILLNKPPISIPITRKRLSKRNSNLLPCHCSLSSSSDETAKPPTIALQHEGRRLLIASLFTAAAGIFVCDGAEAVSTSRRALKASKVPESEFKTLPNGLKYYDVKVGSGQEAKKGSRVAVHYVAKWKGITFMTSRQGLGVGGGTPYGFDVGQSERGTVLKGLDLGVQGMRVGGQRLLIVPPELAYGSKGVQEIPPNATIEIDVELLTIKQSPFGSPVKIVEGMSRRPKYLDRQAGTSKKTSPGGAGVSPKRPETSEAARVSEEMERPVSQGQSSGVVAARPSSPPRPSRRRKRSFGALDPQSTKEMKEEGAPSMEVPTQVGRKAPGGPPKKRKGSVILGVDDLGKDIRGSTSHLVPAFNELAEAVPPEKISVYEDLSPEETVVELCSQMAKANYLTAKSNDLFLSLLSEDGQAQRLQSRLSEVEAKLVTAEEKIRDHELAAVETLKTNKGLKAAATLERKNADEARAALAKAEADNRILKVEVGSVEYKLWAKEEELMRARAELRNRELEWEAERDSIRLEGVGDCAEIIPMVLPDLDMGPIHAAIRFCKGEMSEEEFLRWLPPSAEVMDPEATSIPPVPPAPIEDRLEVPLPVSEAVIAVDSQVTNVETAVPLSEVMPSHPSSEPEKEIIAPVRAD